MTEMPVWLRDQVGAAARTLDAVIDATPRLRRITKEDFDQLPPGLDALADILSDEAVLHWLNAGCKTCVHLQRGGPQPAMILFYDAEWARCLACAIAVDKSIKGTAEDCTCDCCGELKPGGEFYPLGIIKGYVAVQGGICVACHCRAAANA